MRDINTRLNMSKFPELISQHRANMTYVLWCFVLLSLSACTSNANKPAPDPAKRDIISRVFDPYRPDIVQGNFISKEQLESIRPGMHRDQVKQIMGTPLLSDVFHANRWDYIFSYRRGETQEEEQRRVTLFFNGLILANIQADALPSERELIMEIDEARKRRKRQDKPVKTPDGPVAKVVPAFPNPTSGVGIPAGGNRQDSE